MTRPVQFPVMNLRGKKLFISVITRIELYSYPDIKPKEIERLDRFLRNVTVVPLTAEVEQKAIEFRRAARRKTPDSIVAATALLLDATLFTNDAHLLSLKFPGLKTLQTTS